MKLRKAQEIEEGHALEDVQCPHGSRWIWWKNPLEMKGMWQQVIYAPDCDCGDPPPPFKEEEP